LYYIGQLGLEEISCRGVSEEPFLYALPAEINMQVSPLQDYILIEPIEKEETTPAGIVIPDTAKEKPQEGKVVAVGPGSVTEEGKRVEMDVKEGDTVIYKKWGGNDVKVNGKEMLIVREEDILATVKN